MGYQTGHALWYSCKGTPMPAAPHVLQMHMRAYRTHGTFAKNVELGRGPLGLRPCEQRGLGPHPPYTHSRFTSTVCVCRLLRELRNAQERSDRHNKLVLRCLASLGGAWSLTPDRHHRVCWADMTERRSLRNPGRSRHLQRKTPSFLQAVAD
jgi:hypothetical protein